MGNSVLSDLRAVMPAMKSMVYPRGSLNLRTMLTTAGCECCRDRNYDWHGLKRGRSPFTLVQHTLEGRGQLLFEGRLHEIRAGDTMLLQFPHDNRYWLPAGGEWTFFWICMNGREALRIWRRLLRHHGPIVRLSPDTVTRLARLCLEIVKGEHDSTGRASAAAYSAIMILSDELLLAPRTGRRDRHPAIQHAIEYAQNHLEAPLNVDRLAGIAGLSRYHFSRVFKQSEGLSPVEYLQRERMNRAVRMLQIGGEPVGVIADACGFSDPNYFAKAFRRTFGVSPSQFQSSGPAVSL